jgi:hypothetical protein
MGRRVRRFLIIIPAAAMILLSLLLATCSNGFDIFEAIKTEMKVANDLFLEVKSISPEENATLVNPGVPIIIVFDRSIDPDTANESTILITPAPDPAGPLKSLDFDDYNDNTKTLTVEPIDFMDGPETYEVRITKGVKGADGSELQDEIVWSFETRQWPAGSVTIAGGVEYLNHTNAVTLTIEKNTAVNTVEIGNELLGDGSINVLYTGNVNTVPSYNLASGEGALTVYARFGDGVNFSDIETDTIFRDTVAPTVNTGSDRTITIYTSPSPPDAVWQYATVTDSAPSSHIGTYSWTLQPGAPGTITFGTPNAEDTTILASADSANTSAYYTLRLTATDKAGNSDYDDVQILWDRTPPGTPSFTASTTTSPTLDTTPTWAWETGGGGSGTYRRTLDGGGYTYTTSTSYTPSSAMSYGPHTLTVEERDSFNNYSSVASRTIYISPDIEPLWGARFVSRTPTLSWPDAGALYTYDVYFGTSLRNAVKITTTTKETFSIPTTLGSLTTYYWFYYAKYGKISVRFPSDTNQAYTFSTKF